MTEPSEISELLTRWSRGDRDAGNRVFGFLYEDLRRRARRARRSVRGKNLPGTTSLVHEAWLQLSVCPVRQWQGRNHFFALVFRVMANILKKSRRAQLCQKRGGGAFHHSLENLSVEPGTSEEGTAMEEEVRWAFQALQQRYPERARAFLLRHVAEMTIEEAAQGMGVSPSTLKRYCKSASIWLLKEMSA